MRPSSSIRLLQFVAIMFAALTSTAAAQDNRLGLVMGYPPDVGVSWQINNRLALRGDVGFQWNESETSSNITTITFGNATSTTTMTSNTSTQSVSFGVAALISIRNEDNLRLYTGPRVAYRSTQLSVDAHTTRSGISSLDEDQHGESTGHTTQIEGLFGAQYRLGERFAVFGETGIGYSTSTLPSVSLSRGSNIGLESKGRAFSFRNYGGVVLFF